MSAKILSIIIPYYKESERELLLPLASIFIQTGIDFRTIECILVNDGFGKKLSEEFLSLCASHLSVHSFYQAENKGPGAARQTGIDNAEGEYVMFCDADDSLYSVLALKSLIESIRQGRPDIILSPVIREEYDEKNKQMLYVQMEDMRQVLHGKVYRKAFLEANDIHFHDGLRTCEDTYFNSLCFACSEDVRKSPLPSYVKKYNINSLTSADSTRFHMENMTEYIKSIGCLLAAIECRDLAAMQNTVVQYVLYFFFLLHKKSWLNAEKCLLNKTEQEFYNMIKKYLRYYEQTSTAELSVLYPQLRAEYFASEIENETLDEWLKRLGGNIL